MCIIMHVYIHDAHGHVAWSSIPDPDACVYGAKMYDAHIYDPGLWSLNASMYDAQIYDAAEILLRTNEPTDKAILGVGCTNVFSS